MGKSLHNLQVRDALLSLSAHFFSSTVFWLPEIRRPVRYDFGAAGDGHDSARPLAGQKEDLGGHKFRGINGRLENAGERKP